MLLQYYVSVYHVIHFVQIAHNISAWSVKMATMLRMHCTAQVILPFKIIFNDLNNL